MADVRRTWSPEAEFEYNDYSQSWQDDIEIIITCRRTVNLLAGLVDTIGFVGTRWHYDGSSNIPDVALAEIENWHDEARRCLVMACDGQDIVDQLTRMADALESLDAKAAAFYSYTDFIQDLEDALGIGSLIHQVVTGIIGLMPRLQAKVDFTWLARSVWEYKTWRAPVLALLTAISKAQVIQAAAAATGKTMDIANTIMHGVDIVQTTALGWKDIIFGDKSIWDDVIMPLWDNFIGPEGDENEPDNDPLLRMTALLGTERNLRLAEQNVILTAMSEGIEGRLHAIATKKCGCSGACSCGASIENVPSESGTEGSLTPPIPFVTIEYGPTPTTPGTPEYYDRKCKAANRIHTDLVNYITHLDNINIVDQSVEFMFTSLSALLGITSSWPIIGTVMGVISGWLISLQSALAETGVDLSGLVTALNNNAEDLICALYNSTSATEALTSYTDILSTAGIPAIDIAIVETALTPDVLNYLHFQNDGYVEAVLSEYTPPYACDCGCEDYLWPNTNDITPGTHDWTSEWDGIEYKILVKLCIPDAFSIRFNSITGYTDLPGHTDWRLFSPEYDWQWDNSDGDVYNSPDTPPPLGVTYNNVNTVCIWSSNPAFTVNVTIS